MVSSIPVGVVLDWLEKSQPVNLSIGLTSLCPELESDQHQRLRSPLHYPLCYRGNLYLILHLFYCLSLRRVGIAVGAGHIFRFFGGTRDEDAVNSIE